MTVPAWIDAMVADFGRSAGVKNLALGERGAAALSFETGAEFRLEYVGEELVMAVTMPGGGDLRRLLALSHPRARHGGFRMRTGVVAKSGRRVMAVRIPERDVTLPTLNAAFVALWSAAGEMGGER